MRGLGWVIWKREGCKEEGRKCYLGKIGLGAYGLGGVVLCEGFILVVWWEGL